MLTQDELLRETLLFRIRDARVKLVSLAAIPAEAAALAAQQVQNVRIVNLETPKDVGWAEIALDFLITFAINSSFVEKLAAKLFSRVFGRLLSQQAALDKIDAAFLKDFEDKLLPAQRRLAQAGSPALANALRPSPGTGLLKVAPGQVPSVKEVEATAAALKKLAEIERPFAEEVARSAKLKPLDQHSAGEYATVVSDVLSRLDKKDAASFVKATKQVAPQVSKKALGHRPSNITGDTAGVGVTEHFMSAAAALRLHAEAMHNYYEWLVRVLPLSSETIAHLFEMFDRQSLLDGLDREKIELDQLRANLKPRIEALIWAVHYGFSEAKLTPDIVTDRTTEYDCIIGVPDKTTKYLFERFGELVDDSELAANVHWNALTTGNKAFYLRKFLWKLTKDLDLP